MAVIWLAVLTALLWGSAPVFEKAGLEKINPLIALTFRTLVIGVILGITVISTGAGKEMLNVNRRALLYIAAGGIMSGLLGQYVYYHALRLGEVSRVVPVAATYPLIAAIIAIMFIKEPVTVGKIIGAVFIVLGVLAIRFDKLLFPR